MQFRDLLDAHRIPYQTAGRYTRPGWLQMRCPFCHGGQDPDKLYLGYNTVGNYANCWRCGKHSPAALLAALTGLGATQARQAVLGLARAKRASAQALGVLVPPKGVLALDDPAAKAHRNYLARRGFTDINGIIKLWRPGAIAIAPRLQWRLFLPIDRHGVMVSWTTRSISDIRKDRYVGAAIDEESYPAKKLLYGEDYCRHAALVVEGPLDVWAIGPGAVALCGTGFTVAQVRWLARYPVRAICFDGEPAAQKRARALVDALLPFPGETLNITLDAKDPADALRSAPGDLRKLRQTVLGG